MIITGLIAVNAEGKALHKQACIWDDGHVDEIAKIAEVVHGFEADCIILSQLGHGGRQGLLDIDYVGPSAVLSPLLKKALKRLRWTR